MAWPNWSPSVASGYELSGVASRQAHARDEGAEPGTVVLPHLSPEQVERLHAVGPLVDRVQAVVTVELLDGILAGETVAA
jgi:hypothetical protein